MEEAVEGASTAPVVETQEATPELATPETGGQELGTADSGSTGQTFTVKVGGEPIEVSLDEALNGYMRQADYTQKTQGLAQQREELSYAEQIAQALESDPEAAIRALTAAYDVPLTFQQAATAQAPAEPLDPEEARLAGIESYIAQQELRAFEAGVKADLAEVHTNFGEFDDQAVIAYAVQNGIPNIKAAASAFLVDRVMDTAKRQVAERQAQARKDGLAPVAGGHGVAGGTVQTGGAAPVTTIREALALAEASHGATL